MPQRKRIPSSEAILDAAVEYTFPASDPISIDYAYRAREREQRAAESRGATRGEDDTGRQDK